MEGTPKSSSFFLDFRYIYKPSIAWGSIYEHGPKRIHGANTRCLICKSRIFRKRLLWCSKRWYLSTRGVVSSGRFLKRGRRSILSLVWYEWEKTMERDVFPALRNSIYTYIYIYIYVDMGHFFVGVSRNGESINDLMCGAILLPRYVFLEIPEDGTTVSVIKSDVLEKPWTKYGGFLMAARSSTGGLSLVVVMSVFNEKLQWVLVIPVVECPYNVHHFFSAQPPKKEQATLITINKLKLLASHDG